VRGVEQCVDSIGDRLVAIIGGVLVTQRGARAGVTETAHEFFCAGACLRGHRSGEVSQIVEVKMLELELRPSAVPLARPCPDAKWRTPFADEHRRVLVRGSPRR
jgi:hypothetical protein